MKMEVQGKRVTASLEHGTQSLFDFFCEPCNIDGNHLEAAGYCETCREYLCSTCYKHHKRPTAMRHHVLHDKEHMPRASGPISSKPAVICTELCRKHAGEVMKYFCDGHNLLGCSECLRQYHRTCEQVLYIPDVAGSVEHTQEYKSLMKKLKKLSKYVQKMKNKAEENMEQAKKCEDEAIAAIDNFKEGKILHISTLAFSMENKVQAKMNQQNSQLQNGHWVFTDMLYNINLLSTDLTNKNKIECKGDLFVAVKNGMKQLQAMTRDMAEWNQKEQYSNFIFKPNEDLLSQHVNFGWLTDEPEPQKDADVPRQSVESKLASHCSKDNLSYRGPCVDGVERSDLKQDQGCVGQEHEEGDQMGEVRWSTGHYSDSQQLFVGYPHDMAEMELKQFFEAFGNVDDQVSSRDGGVKIPTGQAADKIDEAFQSIRVGNTMCGICGESFERKLQDELDTNPSTINDNEFRRKRLAEIRDGHVKRKEHALNNFQFQSFRWRHQAEILPRLKIIEDYLMDPKNKLMDAGFSERNYQQHEREIDRMLDLCKVIPAEIQFVLTNRLWALAGRIPQNMMELVTKFKTVHHYVEQVQLRARQEEEERSCHALSAATNIPLGTIPEEEDSLEEIEEFIPMDVPEVRKKRRGLYRGKNRKY